QKGYTTMPFEDFCVARTMEGLDKGTRDLVSCLGTNHVYDSMAAWTRLFGNAYAKGEDDVIPVVQQGRSGAAVRTGGYRIGERNNGWIQMQPITQNGCEKINKNPLLNAIEYKVMHALSTDPLAKVARARLMAVHPRNLPREELSLPVSPEHTFVEVERLVEPSLYDRSVVYDPSLSEEQLQQRQQELYQEYKTLVEESMHIAARLTTENMLSAEDKKTLMDDKYASLQGIADAEQNYNRVRIEDVLGTSLPEFTPVQELLNEGVHAWISDRSPKNRKEKNFDFGKIDYAALPTELTLVLDMSPLLSRKEREQLLEHGVTIWNQHNVAQETFDNNFVRRYDAACFYRALLNANHCMHEAKTIHDSSHGGPQYFEYARQMADAGLYLGWAKMSLDELALPNASSLWKKVRAAFREKASWTNENDLAIDHALYCWNVLPPEMQKASRASADTSRSATVQDAV
ncbi:MAG: hypothetical protein V1725_00885, partial [archaeon]